MQRWSARLETIGPVQTFDYEYMIERRRRPDPLPKLISRHRAALAALREKHSGPLVLIGKSMGGRIGCHVSLQEKVSALICLGYPLCGGGDPAKLRDKVLREIRTPILFVQGTRDSLCPLDLLAQVRSEMVAPHELFVVQNGDHSLVIPKKQPQHETDALILQAIGKFIARL